MITVNRATILFFQFIYFALFVTFLVNGIWRWSESNISSRILTQESGFEWPSVTICPMLYNSLGQGRLYEWMEHLILPATTQ